MNYQFLFEARERKHQKIVTYSLKVNYMNYFLWYIFLLTDPSRY